ncbi:zinc finger, CCHC-type containing protein, partial [Tanacetum coccineum]
TLANTWISPLPHAQNIDANTSVRRRHIVDRASISDAEHGQPDSACDEGSWRNKVEPVYVQNRVSVNEISSLKEGKLEWRKMVKCKYVRSGCTTALDVVPWETDGESVLRESCSTRASMTNTQTPPTVVNTTGAPVTNAVANHAEKPEKFNGQNFKRWQQKMFFYLTTLGCCRFLKETAPQLNLLRRSLYNVYCKDPPTAKDKNYGNVIGTQSTRQKMLVQDLQVLLHDIHAEGMTLSETFQVAAIIEKLPPSWLIWLSMLGHLQGLLTKGNKKDKKEEMGQRKDQREVENTFAHKCWDCENRSFQEWTCYNCDKQGHRAANCKMPKRVKPGRAVDNGQKCFMGTLQLLITRIRKTLAVGWLLNKFGFRLVFESDKFVLSKNQMYVGQQWREAIKSEIESILQNHTWELVDLPPGCKPLGYKWIFKKKMKADGTVDKYKARVRRNIYETQPEGFIAPGNTEWARSYELINGLVLSQAHYVDKILNTHNAGDSGQARTPIDTSTRPDLAYAVSRLSRYTSNPSYAHWKAITRVLHYLRYSRDYGLHYDRHPAVIEGYSDANWISDIKDSRSTSGYVFTLGGAAISWKSSKQTVIAKSTMESEFIALDKCGEEAEWLRQFVEDIPRWPKPVTAISIHCDSKSAMGRAKSTMYNGKSRHIRRRHNSIRQLLSTGVISIDYVASKDNIADPFTKGLSRELVSKSSKGMGLKPLKE